MKEKYFDSILVSNPFQASIFPEAVVVTITNDEVKPMKIKTAQKALERIKNFLKENCKHWKQDVSYIEQALKEAAEYKKEQEQKNKDNANCISKLCVDLSELQEFARIMASRRFIVPRLQDSMIMFYDVDKRHSETEFDLVERIMDKYGKRKD